MILKKMDRFEICFVYKCKGRVDSLGILASPSAETAPHCALLSHPHSDVRLSQQEDTNQHTRSVSLTASLRAVPNGIPTVFFRIPMQPSRHACNPEPLVQVIWRKPVPVSVPCNFHRIGEKDDNMFFLLQKGMAHRHSQTVLHNLPTLLLTLRHLAY